MICQVLEFSFLGIQTRSLLFCCFYILERGKLKYNYSLSVLLQWHSSMNMDLIKIPGDISDSFLRKIIPLLAFCSFLFLYFSSVTYEIFPFTRVLNDGIEKEDQRNLRVHLYLPLMAAQPIFWVCKFSIFAQDFMEWSCLPTFEKKKNIKMIWIKFYLCSTVIDISSWIQNDYKS